MAKINIDNLVRVLKSLIKSDSFKSIKPAEVLFVRHDANLNYAKLGKKYCTLLGDLQEWCVSNQVSFLALARPYSVISSDESWDAGLLVNRRFFLADSLNFLAKFFVKKTVNFRFKFWKPYLLKISPKVIICIRPDIGLARAASELGIELIEVQHGVIDHSHWWYGKKSANELRANELPSIYFCWNSYSAEVINSWGRKKNKKVYVTGHPWVEKIKREDVFSTRADNLKKPKILISLQPDPEKDDSSILDSELVKTIKESTNKYSWSIRLHPLQLQAREKAKVEAQLLSIFGKDASVDWERASKKALPTILAESNLHITRFSSVVLEASMLGVKSILMSPNLKTGEKYSSLFSEERASGMAVLSSDFIDLESAIESLLSYDRVIVKDTGQIDSSVEILNSILVSNG